MLWNIPSVPKAAPGMRDDILSPRTNYKQEQMAAVSQAKKSGDWDSAMGGRGKTKVIKRATSWLRNNRNINVKWTLLYGVGSPVKI